MQADDKDGQQGFYAGGAKSGMMVQGPPDTKQQSSALVENILKQAAG